jgi:hypothetical protein
MFSEYHEYSTLSFLFPEMVTVNGYEKLIFKVGNTGQLWHPGPIDFSWVDWAYKSSTCDVVYFRQRCHFYYCGQVKKYYLPPLHRSS